jgi:hypothetical protein
MVDCCGNGMQPIAAYGRAELSSLVRFNPLL